MTWIKALGLLIKILIESWQISFSEGFGAGGMFLPKEQETGIIILNVTIVGMRRFARSREGKRSIAKIVNLEVGVN